MEPRSPEPKPKQRTKTSVGLEGNQTARPVELEGISEEKIVESDFNHRTKPMILKTITEPRTIGPEGNHRTYACWVIESGLVRPAVSHRLKACLA